MKNNKNITNNRNINIKRDIASGKYTPTQLKICIGTDDYKIMCILQRAILEFMKIYGDSFEYDITYNPDKECLIYSEGTGVINYFEGVILYYGKKYKLHEYEYECFSLYENDEGRVIDPTAEYYYMIDHYEDGTPYVANVYFDADWRYEVVNDDYFNFSVISELAERGIIKKC